MKKPLTLTTTMVNDVPTAHVIRDADDWGIARLHPAVFFHQCGEALVRAYNVHDDLVAALEKARARLHRDAWNNKDAIDAADAALAKARGE